MSLLHLLSLSVSKDQEKKPESDAQSSESSKKTDADNSSAGANIPAIIVSSESNSVNQNAEETDIEKSINSEKSGNSDDPSSQGARDKAGALLASKMDYYKTVGE